MSTIIRPGFIVNPDGLALRSRDIRHFILLEDLPFVCPDGSKILCLRGTKVDRLFRRPTGPETDGASTPPPMWGTGLPPFGWYAYGVIGHDCGYQGKTLPILNKDESDQFLRWGMESLWPLAQELGVPRVVYEAQRFAIYEGVHLFGEHAFLEDRTTLENVRTLPLVQPAT